MEALGYQRRLEGPFGHPRGSGDPEHPGLAGQPRSDPRGGQPDVQRGSQRGPEVFRCAPDTPFILGMGVAQLGNQGILGPGNRSIDPLPGLGNGIRLRLGGGLAGENLLDHAQFLVIRRISWGLGERLREVFR